jgi:hypothetical protein
MSAGTQIRTATAARRPRFRGQLKSASRRTLQQIHSRFLNAAGKVDTRLRTTRHLLISIKPAAGAASRKLRAVASRPLRVMRSASVPIRRGSKFRLRLPSISPAAAIGRNLRRAHSSLRCALAGAGNRLRPAADYVVHYKVPVRFHAACKLDRTTLRRAIPPLAVLAAIVMFVIEEIATVVRR